MCDFDRLSNAVMLTHTEVPLALEGRGVGSTLVRGRSPTCGRRGWGHPALSLRRGFYPPPPGICRPRESAQPPSTRAGRVTKVFLGEASCGEGVTVFYDARRCLHVAGCVRGLPNVFDPDARPRIRPGNAPAESVADVVRRCPTGALRDALADGHDESARPERARDAATGRPAAEPRAADDRDPDRRPEGDEGRPLPLRGSGNQPFCDGTHPAGAAARASPSGRHPRGRRSR